MKSSLGVLHDHADTSATKNEQVIGKRSLRPGKRVHENAILSRPLFQTSAFRTRNNGKQSLVFKDRVTVTSQAMKRPENTQVDKRMKHTKPGRWRLREWRCSKWYLVLPFSLSVSVHCTNKRLGLRALRETGVKYRQWTEWQKTSEKSVIAWNAYKAASPQNQSSKAKWAATAFHCVQGPRRFPSQ